MLRQLATVAPRLPIQASGLGGPRQILSADLPWRSGDSLGTKSDFNGPHGFRSCLPARHICVLLARGLPRASRASHTCSIFWCEPRRLGSTPQLCRRPQRCFLHPCLRIEKLPKPAHANPLFAHQLIAYVRTHPRNRAAVSEHLASTLSSREHPQSAALPCRRGTSDEVGDGARSFPRTLLLGTRARTNLKVQNVHKVSLPWDLCISVLPGYFSEIQAAGASVAYRKT